MSQDILSAAIHSPFARLRTLLGSIEPGAPAIDRAWARRFRQDSWPRLMHDWNAQAVFGGRRGPERRESDFDREAFA